jgi:uncharacterized iron-regulated protein
MPTLRLFLYLKLMEITSKHNLTKAFALSLGFFLICTVPAYGQPQSEKTCETRFVASKCVNSVTQLIPEIAKANVVYLGETHDSAQDHENQLKIIQGLYGRNRKIALAMEMFQRPYQDVINQYLAGKITEAQLIKQTEYNERWGFPWELYAPIMRYAKTNNLPVLALNTKSEITRKVSRQGLESLTAEERKLIPPFSEIRTDNEEYRSLILAAFEGHQSGGHGNSSSAERFFVAQVLWDETMAEGVANFVKANPDYQVIVLAGRGHIVFGYGIPSRLKRRLGSGKLIQRSVLLSLPEDEDLPKAKKVADFILE